MTNYIQNGRVVMTGSGAYCACCGERITTSACVCPICTSWILCCGEWFCAQHGKHEHKLVPLGAVHTTGVFTPPETVIYYL
jgi:hypothetical protein